MPNSLSKFWARVVGLKEWDREATSLRNTLDDETPAPGELPGRPTPKHLQDQVPLSADERKERYELWEGEDPGH